MSGPDRAVAAVRSAVTAATADVPPGALVLVACSGGPDSLALAAATAFVADRARRGARRRAPRRDRPAAAGAVPAEGGAAGGAWRAGAVVVDHGLQPGSAQVAARAAQTCRELGLDPVRVVRVDPAGPGGPEAAARDARYAAIEAVAAADGACAVLLGHTLDDQAETVLLGLARGSGVRSLAGMPTRRGLLRRPLLALRRTDTLQACAALGIEVWHDPTNAPAPGDASAPRRSRLRTHAMPALLDVLGPGLPTALARTADQLREAGDALDELADDLLARARLDGAARSVPAVQVPVGDTPGNGMSVVPVAASYEVTTLRDAPTGLRRWALRTAALRAGCPAGSLRREHVLALDALLVDWHGQGPVALPGPPGVPAAGWRACGTLALGPAGRPGSRTDRDPDPRTDDRQER
ncbi:tRNA lysidine(34) synthetase TilS [Cellulomonas soli]|uniref:tRNA lysidine(34) synthetase TilS n=1 Tax=Cellulomonas soli TaxID=931535 RepID=UPI003F8498BE